MRKHKALSTILILIIAFLIIFLLPHQIKIMASIIAGILLLYIHTPMEEEAVVEEEGYKSPEVELKEEIIASIERKMQQENQNHKVAVIVQPMVVVSDSEFNEKTDTMKTPIEKNELPKVEAPKKPAGGITSYSIAGVHIRYRKMFDDFHSFAVTHGPKSEAELVAKLAPYGFPYTIERSGNLVAFNLGFIRMPNRGFFNTAE